MRCKSRLRTGLILLTAAVVALAVPSSALAQRANIERVVVCRSDDGRLTFNIAFAKPVIVSLDDTVQVAIDADRDSGTGVDGLEYSLDYSIGTAALLTAVDGEPVGSNPSSLRFTTKIAPGTYGFGSSSVAFSIPASTIGDPRRFDFYVFIKQEDEGLDEAPSHVLFSAGASPWTYPKPGSPEAGDAYPVETYLDGSDITLSERPGVVIAVIAASVLGIGAVVAVGGWGVQRRRSRNDSQFGTQP